MIHKQLKEIAKTLQNDASSTHFAGWDYVYAKSEAESVFVQNIKKVCLAIYANDDGLEENGVTVENKAIGDLLEFIADMLMTE